MERVTVLVIEKGAEAALVCAALAKKPEVRVVDAPDVGRALKRLKAKSAPVALAIVGAQSLADSAELVKRLQPRGVPIVAVVPELPVGERERALAAGVREIHERPTAWRSYSELIESLIARFVRPE
jgi:CheY-like chemotaxis protein